MFETYRKLAAEREQELVSLALRANAQGDRRSRDGFAPRRGHLLQSLVGIVRFARSARARLAHRSDGPASPSSRGDARWTRT